MLGHDIFRAVGEATEITDPYPTNRPIRSLHVYFYLQARAMARVIVLI
jgi:hypothetical protein